MTRVLNLLLGVALILWSTRGFATESGLEDGITLYSHYEFTQLSEANQVKYLDMLDRLMMQLEKRQEVIGAKYETAMNVQMPWFAVILETAEAQTVRSAGQACVFAANFSTYAKQKRLTCINNNKCEKNPKQIECNPVLMGREGLCTGQSEGATARCMQLKKKNNVNNKDIAAWNSSSERRQAWNDFKSQFDSFCPGVLKNKKDVNYKSCQLMQNDVLDVQKEMDALGPAKEIVKSDPGPRPLTPQVIPGACGRAGSGTCIACPRGETVKQETAVTTKDIGNGKYGQLIRVMATACGVNNKSDSGNGPTGVSSKSVEELVRKFGVCADSDYPESGKFTKYFYDKEKDDPKQKQMIEALVNGDSTVHNKMSGGLWYQGPDSASEAMQAYFGINIKDARQVFCTNSTADVAIGTLRAFPDFGFLHEGITQNEINSLLRDQKPINSVPSTFPRMENQVDGSPVSAMNNFKIQAARRAKLANCLTRNLQDPNRQKKVQLVEVPRNCNLLSFNVGEDDFGPSLLQVVTKHGPTCVKAGPGGVSGLCTMCDDKGCHCKAPVKGPATLEVLDCASTAPGVRANTPSGQPTPGSRTTN